MPFLQIFRNKSNAIYNYTVLKGSDLYEVNIARGEKMKWRYVGKIDPKVYQVAGTLVHNPSVQMISILQRVLQPPVKESFRTFDNWLKEEANFERGLDPKKAMDIGDPKIRKKEKQFIQAVQELGYSEIDAKRFIRTENFHGDEVRILGIKGNGLLFGFNYYDNYEWQYQAWDYKGQDASSDDTWMNINKSDAQKAYKKFEK